MLVLLISLAVLQSNQAPAAVQAALFQKILHYDEAIPKNGERPTVLYVHAGSLVAEDVPIVDAFAAAGLAVVTAAAAEVDAKLPGVNAVYVRTSGLARLIAKACVRHGVLTMTGDPDLVEEQLVAVGIGVKTDGRPQIVISRSRLRQERHELSALLLGLARVLD